MPTSRGDGRPALRRRRALVMPTRSSACTRPPRSTASRRPCWAPAGCSEAARRGLHERATVSVICAYYERVSRQALESGRVELFHQLRIHRRHAARIRPDGRAVEVPQRAGWWMRGTCRPTSRPNAGAVRGRGRSTGDPGQRPVRVDEGPSQYVVVGSGKTATDACIWLLGAGRRPELDLLGPAPRSLDVRPCRGAAGSRGLPRAWWRTRCRPPPRPPPGRPLPAARGRRDHARIDDR